MTIRGMPLATEPVEGKFIRFEFARATGKTAQWEVIAKKGGDLLGTISWYGPWRKYAFEPEPFCVFEEVCLGEIASFIEARTKEHRAAA